MTKSYGKVTHSHAPNRMIEHPDGSISIGINRKPIFYFSAHIKPDGTFAVATALTRKKALAKVNKKLGHTAAQISYYHGNNA